MPALDHDSELDFQLFGDSGSGFGSSKKRNRNTSSIHIAGINQKHNLKLTPQIWAPPDRLGEPPVLPRRRPRHHVRRPQLLPARRLQVPRGDGAPHRFPPSIHDWWVKILLASNAYRADGVDGPQEMERS